MMCRMLLILFLISLDVASEASLQYQAIGLGTLGGPTSIATCINERGEIAGNSDFTPNFYSFTHAFYWSRATGIVDVTPSNDRFRSYCTAINHRGQVVGAAQYPGILVE